MTQHISYDMMEMKEDRFFQAGAWPLNCIWLLLLLRFIALKF